MRRAYFLPLLLVILGCYHATIETGLPTSSDIQTHGWASSWIFGLVPPSTVKAGEMCPHGIAKVETQLGFLNQVVSLLTFGIYTPMEIKVTCASETVGELIEESPDFVVPEGASANEVQQMFSEAAEKAMKEGRPIFVSF